MPARGPNHEKRHEADKNKSRSPSTGCGRMKPKDNHSKGRITVCTRSLE